MLKWTKKLRIMSMTIMPLSVLFLPISFATNHNATEENGMLYYDGRLFKNEEEALSYLIQSGKVKTGQQKVFGDKARSFINAESGQLNKNFLPDYDISKIKFAWFNAGNGITKNYESARNSYFNPGTVVPRFSDGFTNQTFATEVAARNSINNHRLNTQLGFYDVDFIDDATGEIVKRKLNPFNLKDISEYKKNLANNIDKILEENLLHDSTDKTLGYDIKINGDSEKSSSKNVNFSFNKNTVTNWIGEFIKSNSGKVNYNIMNYDSSKYELKLSEKNFYTKEFYSDKYHSGDMDHDSEKQFTVLENRLKYTIYESGRTFEWNIKDLFDLNLFEIKKILNGPGESGGMYKSINPEVDLEISKHENAFSKLLKNINTFFLNKIKTNTKGLSNAKILNSIAKKSVSNFGIDRDNASLKYDIYESGLPKFKVDLSKYGFWFGQDQHKMWILRNYYDFKYWANYNIKLSSLFKFQIKDSIKNINLFNKLWNLSENNKSKNITISKNGLDLFSGDVSLDQATGKFKFKKKLKIAHNNYQGNLIKDQVSGKFNDLNPKTLDLSINRNQSTYLEYLLIKFRDDLDVVTKHNKNLLDQDGSKLSYQTVFDKYFKKAKGTNKGGLYTIANTFADGTEGRIAYDRDLQTKYKQYIDKVDIFKKYFAQIKDAYSKYHEEYIFEQLSKGIISSEDTLFYGEDNSRLFRPALAEYIINTISDFNPSLTTGIFASADSIATTIGERDALSKQKVNPDLILIAYDNNGNAINAGDYKYDSADLLEYNSRLSITPKRDFDHIFVEGYNGPVSNQINNIYWVTFDNHRLYFDQFYNLKTFMLKYIKENAEIV